MSIPSSSSSNPAVDYFFLYDKPFLGFTPPNHIFAFCVVPSLVYLACVFVIFPLLAPRSKSAVLLWAKIRDMHNLFLCIYSGFACYTGVADLIRNNQTGFWTLNLQDMMPYLCDEPSDYIKLINYTFIASKVYEMLDSMFIVFLKNDHARAILDEAKGDGKNKNKIAVAVAAAGGNNGTTDRKSVADVPSRETAAGSALVVGAKKSSRSSELNFLHVYHHCTTFWLFLLCADLPSSTRGGLIFNGGVHFLMYGHYTKPFPKAVVPFITMAQIAQLAFVTWAWYLSSYHCPAHSGFPQTHFYEYWTPYLMVPVYLFFFIKMFVERFVLGRGGKKTQKKD